MKTSLKSFFLFIFFLLNIEYLKAEKKFYVFYRGYHFIDENEDTIHERLSAKSGQRNLSRAAQNLPEEDLSRAAQKLPEEDLSRAAQNLPNEDLILTSTRKKLISLKGDYLSSKLSTLLEETPTKKQLPPSFFHQIIESYVNSYQVFNQDIQNPESPMRKKLAKLGLNIDCNFLISTSLHPTHAVRYGAGEKLYSNPELRRLPNYDETLKPRNPVLGYVDVFIIPEEEIEQTGGFFVVEEFAKYNIFVNHCPQKNLTHEEEITFPLFIDRKYHSDRIPIMAPDFSIPYSETSVLTEEVFNIRKKKLSLLIAAEQKQPSEEENIVKEVIKILAEKLKSKTKELLKEKHEEILQASPASLHFYPQFLPEEAVVIRKRIHGWVDFLGHRSLRNNKLKINLRNHSETFNFFISHALAVLSQREYKLSLKASFSFENESFHFLLPFLMSPNLKHLFLAGEDEDDGVRSIVDKQITQGLDVSPWRSVGNTFQDFIKNLSTRSLLLRLDITGQSLDPEYFDTLEDIPSVMLVDQNREEDMQCLSDADDEEYRELVEADYVSLEDGDFDEGSEASSDSVRSDSGSSDNEESEEESETSSDAASSDGGSSDNEESEKDSEESSIVARSDSGSSDNEDPEEELEESEEESEEFSIDLESDTDFSGYEDSEEESDGAVTVIGSDIDSFEDEDSEEESEESSIDASDTDSSEDEDTDEEIEEPDEHTPTPTINPRKRHSSDTPFEDIDTPSPTKKSKGPEL